MKIALITGAGRKTGLGFETARQLGQHDYHVILSGRKAEQLENLTTELINEGLSASFIKMDVNSSQEVLRASKKVEAQYGKLDVLINNAVLFGGSQAAELQDLAEMKLLFETNVLGPWNVTQKFLPLLRKSAEPRIVNVSSGAGSFEDPQYGLLTGMEGIPVSGYGLTKLALNGLTIKMARELAKDNIIVNAVCPDVTDTYSDGYGRSISDGAKGIVWAAMLPSDGPSGGFFRDGEVLPW
ncbi:SDR family NAD(P)-dependent oxidoreductase [Enterococcus sp. HY326]|uniref:SDR family NAD(P)-dependent oxidoreductase n=1 Tax=Enterococcus sp. HY326 TaxID=2971265 RepID=UPI00223F85F2|nr:SDR family NAD(P)-dependent oxidoreductase [Enterococcus sp. HY326]